MNVRTRDVGRGVQRALSPDLLKEPWRARAERGTCHPMTGHCYVATEAAWHLLGGRRGKWRPMFIRHEGQPHWFLVSMDSKRVLDLTAAQFKTPVPYHKGVGKGFLTKRPSLRAVIIINRVRRDTRPD